jgi:hypothetical protein
MSDNYVTFAELAKRQKFGGGIDDIIDVISGTNPIIEDAPVVEGNLPTGHRTTTRNTNPTGTWRQINKGVATEKGLTNQVDDSCGMLEGFSAIDEKLVELSGDKGKFRASEDDAFIAGFNDTVASSLFYADVQVDPEKPHGLSPRYNSLSTGNYANVVNCSGSSTLTSIWIVKWSPYTAHLIYPKGTKAGISSEDMGKILWQDGATPPKHYMAWVTHFIWNLGLTLRDPRYVTRICNIDTSALTDDASTGTDLQRKMVAAYYKVPTKDLGKMAKTFVYCNKTVAEYLHVQAANKTNVNLTLDNSAGEPFVRFMGAPVHICDAITNAETAVA